MRPFFWHLIILTSTVQVIKSVTQLFITFSTSANKLTLKDFFLALWILAVASIWLIPNHYPPWSTFHADALSAIVFLIFGIALCFTTKKRIEIHGIAMFVTLMVLIPGLQYFSGLIPFAGQAWISTVYLFGLLISILTGQISEKNNPNQLVNYLFLAIGIACILSVNLQLRTWFDLIQPGIENIWSMGLIGNRPYANIGQPNQLATLLLWGLLGGLWGVCKRQIGIFTFTLFGAFLMIGISLTQSRTAMIGMTAIVTATLIWRHLWPNKRVPALVGGLYIFFLCCPSILQCINTFLLIDTQSIFFRTQLQNDQRLAIWQMLFKAIAKHPFTGYGWTEVSSAQLAVALESAPLHSVFGHSHNLFIDLIVWTGIPIGIFAAGIIVKWFLTCIFAIHSYIEAILILFVTVIAIHAMLELPLHYAYFLFPTGITIGTLNAKLLPALKWQAPHWWWVALCSGGFLLLVGIINDYIKIESSFRDLRFEIAKIGKPTFKKPVDVIFLNQLTERMRLSSYVTKPNMTPEEIEWLSKVAKSAPTTGGFYKVATAMALNGRKSESELWMQTSCYIFSLEECASLRKAWKIDSKNNHLLSTVSWSN